jgi:Xaa-Pro dipeptidase
MSQPLSASLFQSRLHRLSTAMTESNLESFALNAGPSLTYLTGLHFHLSERPVVAIFSKGPIPTIVLPELEAGKLASLSFDVQPFTYGENPQDWVNAFQQAAQITQMNGAQVGIEPRRFRVLELRFLENAAPKANFRDAEKVLSSLRMKKDENEIQSMRRAVEIAQEALRSALRSFKPGMTERELAAELTLQILRSGSDPEMPFSPIVSAGPNAANPHATPTERAILEGDLLLIDWGASSQGYFSDLTRTFSVGEVEPELVHIAKVVAEANAAGRAAARPGAAAGEVDQAARQVIEQAGYGPYFIHRTGHGLGMEGHEEPYIYAENQFVLEQGMTFTIEPGIYIQGKVGVRIEDDIVISRTGAESLSDIERELVALP